MTKRITVLVYTAGPLPEQRTIDNTLEAMQAIVGGYLETVRLPGGLTLVCNEDGRMERLPIHHAAKFATGSGAAIHGDFFVCRTSGSDFAAATSDDVVRLFDLIRPV